MILFESILDGIRDIRDHFGRTMLQLLGIILGAASIVATFSLSVAGKAASMEYYRVSGGIQKIWIWNKDTGKISPGARSWRDLACDPCSRSDLLDTDAAGLSIDIAGHRQRSPLK